MGYEDIIFMQGEEANEALEILESKGEIAVIEFLSNWDYGDGPINEESQAGISDRTFKDGDYLLTWNFRWGYIGLERIVGGNHEATYE